MRILAVFAALLLAPSCVIVLKGDDSEASGPFLKPAPEREARTVEPFRRVLVEGALDVELRVGAPQALRVEGDRGRLGEVRSEVRGDVLLLTQAAEYGRFHDGPRAVVDVEALDGVVQGGSGWIAVSGLDQARFEAEVRGSGDVLLRGRVDVLDAQVTGSGQIDVAGLAAGRLDVAVRGSGRVRGAPTATPDPGGAHGTATPDAGDAR